MIKEFDKRKGRKNVKKKNDIEVKNKGEDDGGNNKEVDIMNKKKIKIVLRGKKIKGVEDVEVEMKDKKWKILSEVKKLIKMEEIGSRKEKLRSIWENK